MRRPSTSVRRSFPGLGRHQRSRKAKASDESEAFSLERETGLDGVARRGGASSGGLGGRSGGGTFSVDDARWPPRFAGSRSRFPVWGGTDVPEKRRPPTSRRPSLWSGKRGSTVSLVGAGLRHEPSGGRSGGGTFSVDDARWPPRFAGSSSRFPVWGEESVLEKQKPPVTRRLLLWSGKRGSNPRPRAWEARALPAELFPHRWLQQEHVGASRHLSSGAGGEGGRA